MKERQRKYEGIAKENEGNMTGIQRKYEGTMQEI